MVANTAGLRVSAVTEAQKVIASNTSSLKWVTPPKPCQRPKGTIASNSISSARRAVVITLGQVASYTPSIVDMQAAPETLVQKVPSFSLRGPNSGLVRASASCRASLALDSLLAMPSSPLSRLTGGYRERCGNGQDVVAPVRPTS